MVSPLFKELPATFFRPLAGRLAPVYWQVLGTLYALDFEGEPFEITQETAIEQAAQSIEQGELWSDPEGLEKELQAELLEENGGDLDSKLLEDERSARRMARQILRRLEKCGWFDYEYRESCKGNVLNFRDYAARILHTLTQVAEQEQPVFEGLAHSIKAALSDKELEEKPGVALYNAQKATKDLVREIKILSRNIHRYPEKALKEARTPKDLLALQLDVYQKKVVDSSYHRFKTSDNVFKYRSFILVQIERLELDPLLSGSAVQWISRNQATDYAGADGVFDDWLALIRSQLGSIHLLTEDLDRKNARYTATTLQKISYLLNQERDLQGKLVGALKEVAELSDRVSWAWAPGLPCFRVEPFDSDSLYVRPKERVPLEISEVAPVVLSPGKKRAALERARAALAGQYSKDRVYALAEELLGPRGSLEITALPLESGDDFVRAIFLSYHGRDRRAPFELELSDEWKSALVHAGRFSLRPGVFRWKIETSRKGGSS